ncbi:MAG: RagB/SusD family nutrient uptake outer membrane protein [Gemmatimonadales bacterium]|nr:MAG: RagB/SusD family nutrient uptake outer membrane protein [Gemmatimonadales bacterium]
MQKNRNRTGMLPSRVVGSALASLLVVGLPGCDSLLGVTNPASVEADDLNNPALAEALYFGALGRFECAYVNQVIVVSLLTEELINSSNWAPIRPYALRQQDIESTTGGCPDGRNSNATGAYSPLQQARFLAEDGAARIEAFDAAVVSNREEMIGWLEGYAGYATLLLGEGWCEMAFDGGPLQSRQESFQLAETRFSSALDRATSLNNDELRNTALVGRARARLNQGNLSGAASDAEQVTEGFVREAVYATVSGGRENRIANYHNLNRYVTVNWMEYGNLMLGDVPDPRVPVEDTGGLGQSGNVPFWAQLKYEGAGSAIPIASWAEAQLILAEARPEEAEAAINRLRAAQGLPAYEPSGDHIADVLEERRRQLFLEGHRHNDMLRHDLPFPTGANHMGEFRGNVTCLPLPLQERENNQNIS